MQETGTITQCGQRQGWAREGDGEGTGVSPRHDELECQAKALLGIKGPWKLLSEADLLE